MKIKKASVLVAAVLVIISVNVYGSPNGKKAKN